MSLDQDQLEGIWICLTVLIQGKLEAFGQHRPSFGIAPRSVIVHRIQFTCDESICLTFVLFPHTRNPRHTIITRSITNLAAKVTALKDTQSRKPHITRNPRGGRTLAHHGDHRGQGTLFTSTSERTCTDRMSHRLSKSRRRWPRRKRTRPHPSIWDN